MYIFQLQKIKKRETMIILLFALYLFCVLGAQNSFNLYFLNVSIFIKTKNETFTKLIGQIYFQLLWKLQKNFIFHFEGI